jgi:hypothetical protein
MIIFMDKKDILHSILINLLILIYNNEWINSLIELNINYI